MVMLTRGWQRIVAVLRILIALLSDIGSVHSADEAETVESEYAAAVQEKQIAPAAPSSDDSIPLPMRWVSTRPPPEQEFWHPRWAANGTGLMPICSPDITPLRCRPWG
jgi:hypothetical protein